MSSRLFEYISSEKSKTWSCPDQWGAECLRGDALHDSNRTMLGAIFSVLRRLLAWRGWVGHGELASCGDNQVEPLCSIPCCQAFRYTPTRAVDRGCSLGTVCLSELKVPKQGIKDLITSKEEQGAYSEAHWPRVGVLPALACVHLPRLQINQQTFSGGCHRRENGGLPPETAHSAWTQSLDEAWCRPASWTRLCGFEWMNQQ